METKAEGHVFRPAIHDRGLHAKTDALHRKRHVQPEIEGIDSLRFLIRIQPEKNGSIIMRRNSKHGAARKNMLRQRKFATIEPIATAPQPSDDRKKNRSGPRTERVIGFRLKFATCTASHVGRTTEREQACQD